MGNPNIRGIIALTVSMAGFPASDAVLKFASHRFPIGEAVFVRSCMTAVILTLVIAATGRWQGIGRIRHPVVVVRALIDTLATLCFAVVLVRIYIADLAAILLTAPLIMTAIMALVFHEVVGWRRWAAIFIGLAGTLLIVKPSAATLQVWSGLALAVAVMIACRDILTQRIAQKIPTLVISLASALMVSVAVLSFAFVETWQWLTVSDLLIMAVSSVFFSFSNYLLVLAFRGAEISAISPFRYTFVLWSGVAGYVVLGEVPDYWSFAGAALIAASGLYALHRETLRRREISATSTPEM